MGFNNAFFLFILKKLNQLFFPKQDLMHLIIDLPAPVSPVIIENP
jgi:ABC-type sulfate transport system permease subunit